MPDTRRIQEGYAHAAPFPEPIMKLFRIAQAAAVLASLAGAQGALASDGTITFKGAVLTNSCEVDSNGHVPYPPRLAPDFNVGLPSVRPNKLPAPETGQASCRERACTRA